ncbi:M20 metallopeptidase family protein [Alkalihalobacterium alkalinitrilicum]|uniref:M20 metallopeptidase family protein n=1 Tax=Alkalihalobacterium alkalinitrilicum TaxID=427920 RepID=UPI001303A211|nr:M20 family metallopeptidase [Alkalihalobacterium alkalinitrilicum]
MVQVKVSNQENLLNRLIDIRQELHQYPEVSSKEFQTTKRLKDWLTEAGYTILPLEVETGLVAELRGGLPGPTVAYRTDIDALPILEQTGLPYASKVDGVSHACGHDFHMTIALGAAFTIAEKREQLRGTVRFIFQPAEETTQGARQFIEAGLFEDGQIQAIFGVHNQPGIRAGHVGVTDQRLMGAVDTIKIKVKGHSGHGAIPQHAIDSVVAGSAIVMGLQSAVSRNIDPFEPVVITIGSFQSGTTHNVIAESAELFGTVRSFNPNVRAQLPHLIERIARDIAKGYGAEAELEFIPQVPAIDNDQTMTQLVKEAVEEVFGEGTVVQPEPTLGGEDFSLYQQYVPGCFFWVGTGDEEKGVNKQWHDSTFLVNDEVIPDAVTTVVRTLEKALEHFRLNMKEEK